AEPGARPLSDRAGTPTALCGHPGSTDDRRPRGRPERFMMPGLLSIFGPAPASEIVVRDHALRVVSSAPGVLQAEVPPGIYRVDVWIPGTTDVGLVAVRDGEHLTHERRELVADSVVPITGIRSASERHASFARAVAARPLHALTRAGDE